MIRSCSHASSSNTEFAGYSALGTCLYNARNFIQLEETRKPRLYTSDGRLLRARNMLVQCSKLYPAGRDAQAASLHERWKATPRSEHACTMLETLSSWKRRASRVSTRAMEGYSALGTCLYNARNFIQLEETRKPRLYTSDGRLFGARNMLVQCSKLYPAGRDAQAASLHERWKAIRRSEHACTMLETLSSWKRRASRVSTRAMEGYSALGTCLYNARNFIQLEETRKPRLYTSDGRLLGARNMLVQCSKLYPAGRDAQAASLHERWKATRRSEHACTMLETLSSWK